MLLVSPSTTAMSRDISMAQPPPATDDGDPCTHPTTTNNKDNAHWQREKVRCGTSRRQRRRHLPAACRMLICSHRGAATTTPTYNPQRHADDHTHVCKRRPRKTQAGQHARLRTSISLHLVSISILGVVPSSLSGKGTSGLRGSFLFAFRSSRLEVSLLSKFTTDISADSLIQYTLITRPQV